jgi:hypothetical protein
MEFANAASLNRKFGVAEGRDLQFALMEKQNPEALRPRTLACAESETQVPPFRFAPVGMTKLRAVAHRGMGGDGWTEL